MKKKPRRHKLGDKGEAQAVEYLKSQGYSILESNFRFKQLEIDIVAQDNELDELVFVEVKTRKNSRYGTPEQAVNRKKLRNLIHAGQIYLKRNNKNLRAKNFRFDIISVLPDQIKHFKNISIEF